MKSLVALSLAVTLGMTAVAYAASPSALANEAPFLAENQTAMDKMMNGMKIQPSGDVDRDFAAMMIPHHQGAVDMAEAELRYGHNERLRRIARQIIAEQPREITAMRQAFGRPPLPASASTKQPPASALLRRSAVSMMNMQPGR